MNSPIPFADMSVPERLQLIEEIWDSIPESGDALDMPEWHRDELEKRLAAADANPEAGVPWEEAKACLRNSHEPTLRSGDERSARTRFRLGN
jgi:putative addiction module component (TIGR02574 family)